MKDPRKKMFVNSLVFDLKKEYGDEFVNHDEDYIYIKLRKGGTYMLTIDDAYEAAKHCDYYELVEAAIEKIDAIDGDVTCDYDSVKDKIVFKAMWERNIDPEKCYIYKKTLDIALVVYVVVQQTNDMLLSYAVTENVLTKWGKTEDEIFEIAKKNSAEYYTPKLGNLLDLVDGGVLRSDVLHTIDEFTESINEIRSFLPTVITSTNLINGATTIFVTDALERISNHYDDDLYVAFIDVHEAIVHTKSSSNLNSIKLAITEVISERVPKSEFLSDKVYLYKKDEKKLFVVR